MYVIGGSAITKKKETKTETNVFKCPNPSCGKIFGNPVRAEILGSGNLGKYNACPYCLTKITMEKSLGAVEDKQREHVNEVTDKETSFGKEEQTRTMPRVKGCSQYFGFLSKRSTKEKIPEECISCENVVQCMLMAVTS